MTPEELAAAIKEHTRDAYPDLQVRVEDSADEAGAPLRKIYFTEPMFAALYPLQRFHYLIHLFPQDFYEAELEDAEWYELAPGEQPADLVYPDDEHIEGIAERTLDALSKAGVVELLDDVFSPIDPDTAPAECYGDFRHLKQILAQLEFTEQERWDTAHVLMQQGAYCDCEVLFNLAPETRTAQRDAPTHGEDSQGGHEPHHGHGHDHDHDH
jgi:hypothetical protein